jgi:hypothetical protein
MSKRSVHGFTIVVAAIVVLIALPALVMVAAFAAPVILIFLPLMLSWAWYEGATGHRQTPAPRARPAAPPPVLGEHSHAH